MKLKDVEKIYDFSKGDVEIVEIKSDKASEEFFAYMRR